VSIKTTKRLDMKKISLLFLIVLFLGSCSTNKQPLSPEKAAEKAAHEAEDNAWFELAMKAIQDRDFVLEADRVEFKRGTPVYVTANTNFVALKGNRATVQLALNIPVSGPNGIGGITVEGSVGQVEMKTEKKGDVLISMMVQGVGISAKVDFRLIKGTNQCTATVTPNFNSNRISFRGKLYPTEESRVFKGRTL